MKRTNKIKAIALIMLCLPFCGGWTVAPEQSDNRYVGGELISTYASETVSYVSKEIVENISTANAAPDYAPVNDMTNACGAAAGGNIVGFYDKYYENLIPNWASYYSTGMYKAQSSTYATPMIQDLYERMQTNVVAPGVSESEFKNGLKSYVVDHGYNLEYVSLGNGNNFNYSAFKTAVSNNQVVVLFVQPSNLYSISSGTNKDVINTSSISGNHIMVAYGYYEIKYTLSNGGTRTDKYLDVTTGLLGNLMASYKIGSYVDAAYIVKIN